MANGISALDAIGAYGRIGSIGGGQVSRPASGTADSADATGGAGFGSIVSQMVGGTADTLGKAEQASLKQIAGKGDLIDVVTAIGAAENALDTMVAVRDKVVSAYGEIMRMQI